MRILISDNYELIRDGLTVLVNKLANDIEVVTAATDHEAIACARANPAFELAIIGLSLPGSDSLPLVSVMCGLLPETALVFVSASEDQQCVLKTIASGASGFVYKSQKTALLKKALLMAMKGKVFIPPLDPDSEPATLRTITPRQSEVLALLARGKSNKEIAKLLDVSAHTIKNHLSKLYKRLNVLNRTQAVMKASEILAN
ncbi:response regulator transcription factor [Marinobacter sp. CHS3-4]|uniref:response regulator transcription factor n=1 Tax=Marinobacter sp. CHS3-4 TaxID=3045174 RepID=UPI0024B5E242|nr:response regulator transcription factor [Marinobacter sp. CHS3-4]MDI9245144.1 response regulator transcription factor [Marinobacter sp. CHS3-4]